MQQDSYLKEVYFDQYCKTCIHKDLKEDEDPCFECLQEPAREYSHKPERYREDSKKINKTAGEEGTGEVAE